MLWSQVLPFIIGAAWLSYLLWEFRKLRKRK